MIHGKTTGVILDAFDVTRILKEASVSTSIDTAESTMFESPGGAKEYEAGLTDATVSFGGKFTGDALGVEEILANIETADGTPPFLVSFGRLETGAVCRVGLTKETSFAVSAPYSDIVTVSGGLQATGGIRRAIAHGARVAVDPAGSDLASDSVDNTTSSAAGKVYVFVPANSIASTTDVILQHSTDDSTWADLATVSLTSTQTIAQLVEVNETIERYTRLLISPGDTGTIVAIAATVRS